VLRKNQKRGKAPNPVLSERRAPGLNMVQTAPRNKKRGTPKERTVQSQRTLNPRGGGGGGGGFTERGKGGDELRGGVIFRE